MGALLERSGTCACPRLSRRDPSFVEGEGWRGRQRGPRGFGRLRQAVDTGSVPTRGTGMGVHLEDAVAVLSAAPWRRPSVGVALRPGLPGCLWETSK